MLALEWKNSIPQQDSGLQMYVAYYSGEADAPAPAQAGLFFFLFCFIKQVSFPSPLKMSPVQKGSLILPPTWWLSCCKALRSGQCGS